MAKTIKRFGQKYLKDIDYCSIYLQEKAAYH